MTEQLNVQQMAQRLMAADNILILCHKNPDGDTIGSGSALYFALKALDKNAALLCSDAVPARYAFTNAHLFKGEFEPRTVVAVDVASLQLFGERNGVPQYTRHVDLCIDHHAGNTDYADFTLLDSSAAAAAELLGAQGRGVNAELADLLADYLRKLHLDLALLIAQDKGKAYVGACAGLNFGELSVGHGLICILICKDACDIELHAVLEALLNYRPEEGRGAFARVRIAEGDNYCVVSYRVLSENRALIVERAVLKDDVVRV